MDTGKAVSTAPGSSVVIESPTEGEISMDELRTPVADGAEQTVESPTTEQPRDDKGQFAPAEEKPKGVQGRIDELTREKHDARRERDIERTENATLRMENERLRLESAGGAGVEQPATDEQPNAETFEGTHEEFVLALSQWGARQEFVKLQSAQSEVNAESQLGQQKESFIERGEVWAKEHGVDDFRGKTVDNRGIRITETMRDILWNSDDGPAVTVYLANNPTVAESISKLSPSQQAYELGRINATPASPKTITDAPPVVEIPKGGGGEGADKDWLRDPAKDPAGWAARRNKELAGR